MWRFAEQIQRVGFDTLVSNDFAHGRIFEVSNVL
jgi:hypothetical protein